MDDRLGGKSAARQPRAVETRRRILATARVAFAEKGHDNVNLKADILDPAGVSVGSFYHQFKDKTELLLVLLEEAGVERRRSVLGEVQESPGGAGEAMVQGIRAFFDAIDADTDLWVIQLREQRNADPRIRARSRDRLDAWRAELYTMLRHWTKAPDLVVEQAAEYVIALNMGLAGMYLNRPAKQRKADRDSMIEGASSFAVAGLRRLFTADQAQHRNEPVGGAPGS
jgi:AcrR family transcriptional regulator